MAFDPFGDFATRGYLRNHRGYKRTDAVKRLELRACEEGLAPARAYTESAPSIGLAAMHETHRLLFGAVYPWAGMDRPALDIDVPIFKGRLHFARADQVRRIATQALTLASDPSIMARQPGMIMGELAYAHPFLEGNGRTLLMLHAELARRAAIWIDWAAIPVRDYLVELTKEIVLPGRGCLDDFLSPYVRPGREPRIIEQHEASQH